MLLVTHVAGGRYLGVTLLLYSFRHIGPGPEGVNLDSIKIPAGSNETPVKLVATPNAPAGKEYPLTITGSGMHGDRIYRFKAPVVTLAINDPQAEEKEGAKLANTAP